MGDRKLHKKAFVEKIECVACGCCVKVCPRQAIRINQGVFAEIDLLKCVGCGKCERECPASVIEIREVLYEKALV